MAVFSEAGTGAQRAGKKSVVVIGGGTGTHTVLSGLKKFKKEIDIKAIVTMADSGGSTGRLRDEFGHLPVGDVRMALAALAREDDEHDQLIRQLFLHRFDKGDGLSGHNFGNLFLTALTELLGSESKAIRAASKVLSVAGEVLPVTNTSAHLVAEYADGVQIQGEHLIDEPDESRYGQRITGLSLSPNVSITNTARRAIESADLVVIGPGDLYTSLLANCVVDGMADVLAGTKAQLVYVANLMTKAGQTDGMHVGHHVAELIKYIGREPDHVLVNNTPLPADLLARYMDENEHPVRLVCDGVSCQLLHDDYLASEEVQAASGDVLRRSLIRHDPHKLADRIMALLTHDNQTKSLIK